MSFVNTVLDSGRVLDIVCVTNVLKYTYPRPVLVAANC